MAGVPPLKNTAYTFYVSLVSQADTDVFKTSVTLAAGDIKVSIDGATFDNIGTLPTEISTTGILPVALAQAEMDGDVIIVAFHDAAGDEWQDLLVTIETETVQINDLATATALATVDGIVDDILVDTGTTIPGTITTIDDEIAVIDGNVDSILADTGTDGVKIAADAITASTFDESTAFPLKSADTGSTQVARVGADGDTLETLSDQLDTAQADLDNPSQYMADVSGLATAANLATVDGIVDSILEDTGTTIPASITNLDGDVADVFDDVGAVQVTVDAILLDTGTTLPGTLTTIEGKVDTIDTVADAILVDTDVTIPGLIAALNNLSAAQVNAEVVDVLRTDTIPDSYSADGAQPTIAQAVLAIQQFLYERAVAGTTMTVYKPNGLTTAITLTLDDATSPTKYTRSA